MGSVGFPEMIVVFIVALVVLGPDKLPTAAKQVGRAYAEFKRVTASIQDEVRGALDLDTREADQRSATGDPPSPATVPADVPPPAD